MKRIFFNKNYNNLAIGMMFFGLTLVLSACFLPAGCAKIINPATGVATETIDWTKTSTYYHNFLTGLKAALPVAETVAGIVNPAAGAALVAAQPAIAAGEGALSVLDTLIAAKANDSLIQSAASVVQGKVETANATTGIAVTVATPVK